MTYKGSEDDRRFVTLSAGELEQYLSSEVLLWRIKNTNLPLTPGNLLLAMTRLCVVDDLEINTVVDRLHQLIDMRRTAWEKKVSKELPMRLKQWGNQVDEILNEGKLDASYVYQVRTRVIIDLLLEEKHYPDEQTRLALAGVDGKLNLIAEKGEFIWDEVLKDRFPDNRHPSLYLKDKRQL